MENGTVERSSRPAGIDTFLQSSLVWSLVPNAGIIKTPKLFRVNCSHKDNHILLDGNSRDPQLTPFLLPLVLACLFTYARAKILSKAHQCDISQGSVGEGGRKSASLTSSWELWASSCQCQRGNFKTLFRGCLEL